jgi:anti-sigma B factor antagonist
MNVALEIDQDERDDVLVVGVRGELDLYSAPDLRAVLLSAIEAGRTAIVLDLGETTFMDSTALAVVIAAMKALRDRRGRLVLVRGTSSISKTLAITGLDRLLAVEADVETAVAVARGT